MPVAKPKVIVAPERRNLAKVWNISDWSITSVVATPLMILGTVVAPGGAVEVPVERLKNAHKLEKDKNAGLIFIGAKPPKEYLEAKSRRARLCLPKGAKRAHGPLKSEAPVAKIPDPVPGEVWAPKKVTEPAKKVEAPEVEDGPVKETFGGGVFKSRKKK